MNWLLDALGQVGYALDTPGAYLRGALAGNLGGRSSGEELLASYGVDGGPLGGMAAEMVLDPLALAGPALGAFKGVQGINRATKGLAGLAHADDANPLLRAAAAMGDETGAFRPFQEIGRRTDPDFVNSVDWYHGTGTPGLTPLDLDPMKTNPKNLYGRGQYMSAAPPITGDYARTRAEQLAERLAEDPAHLAAVGDYDRRWSSAIAEYRAMVQGAEEEYRRKLAAFYGSVTHLPADVWGERVRAFETANAPQFPRGFEWATARVGPRPTVKADPLIYEANTNFGKILDLDQDAGDRFVQGMEHYARGLDDVVDHRMSSPMNEFEMLMERVDSGDLDPSHGHFVQRLLPSRFKDLPRDMPDPLIKAIREMGYDAMTHTGGGRRGGGRLLHDVLIALDPNDTVSKVGRAGQITRFDPHPADELLRRLGGM